MPPCTKDRRNHINPSRFGMCFVWQVLFFWRLTFQPGVASCVETGARSSPTSRAYFFWIALNRMQLRCENEAYGFQAMSDFKRT